MVETTMSIFDLLPEEDAAQYRPKKSDDWKWTFADYPKEKNGFKVFSCFALSYLPTDSFPGSNFRYYLCGQWYIHNALRFRHTRLKMPIFQMLRSHSPTHYRHEYL